ncbi:MAG: GFA family protein [Gammaproteobacteria bacterium]|nr:GFA family protein [Gammaproteobacteria bacterium]
MSNQVQKKGRCLCGKVAVSAKAVDPQVHACHCNMCRLWNGGPTLSVHCGTDVSFTNEEYISVYKSCAWAELGFCTNCGSHLFYRAIDNGEYILQAGTFESDDGFVLNQQVFIDEKPSYYSFANKTSDLTGAEVFAQYATKE